MCLSRSVRHLSLLNLQALTWRQAVLFVPSAASADMGSSQRRSSKVSISDCLWYRHRKFWRRRMYSSDLLVLLHYWKVRLPTDRFRIIKVSSNQSSTVIWYLSCLICHKVESLKLSQRFHYLAHSRLISPTPKQSLQPCISSHASLFAGSWIESTTSFMLKINTKHIQTQEMTLCVRWLLNLIISWCSGERLCLTFCASKTILENAWTIMQHSCDNDILRVKALSTVLMLRLFWSSVKLFIP